MSLIPHVSVPSPRILDVVPAKAGTHNHGLWNMGPRLRGDDSNQSEIDEIDHIFEGR
jgi:hypothetical protein